MRHPLAISQIRVMIHRLIRGWVAEGQVRTNVAKSDADLLYVESIIGLQNGDDWRTGKKS